MRDQGRHDKDTTLEKIIWDNLKFESSPDDQDDSMAECFHNLRDPKITDEDESIIYNIEEEIKDFQPNNQSALFKNS